MDFFASLSPWILVLYLSNGNVEHIEVETHEQCLRHGTLLIALEPSRFTIKEPICLPYQQVDKPRRHKEGESR